MARAQKDSTPKGAPAEETTPDVSVVTDDKAGKADSPAQVDGPEDGPEDGVVQTDGGGRTLVEVVADGVVVRVGEHPLMLSRGQRARVTSDVAERKSFRRV